MQCCRTSDQELHLSHNMQYTDCGTVELVTIVVSQYQKMN
jgi:hypothetical protein